MRIVIYEWCMSGGLAGADAPIAREGRMMLEALAADAVKDAAHEVTVLVEAGRAVDLPARARRQTTPAGADRAPLVAAARAADWTLIVAPETDGALADRVQTVRAVGGRVLAPADGVIALATDKQATIDALGARGLPVPAGRSLAAGEPLPAGFLLPAVRKARAGCGCDGLEFLASHDVPAASAPSRIEAFAPGTPVGVSCICGPRSTLVLPPLRQRFSTGSPPRYLGSDPLADAALATRATALARAAAGAIGAEAGWLGVDMILGARPDGGDDRILEVNPRVTTSFVGHARAYPESLVAAMIAMATGSPPVFTVASGGVPSAAAFRLDDPVPPAPG